ncbi:N-acetylmuramoyl-L-alanine amidase [Paenibacillus sp. 598K]|uniref:N-acetylmuramoyl-L-alanine amidase family protein n=1 Tax=Paenibacillus sp. 598K TaxID=1117987 RepID=UPI000FF9F198|nr:N-acetylmuramoyl-L-alanine amidase family protein [Paenibacillus sp. 598K]GBF75915.1 N-acetylmuramoyl-L-alanine amidase [Paenibacillus sp. 598K]
MRLVWKQLALLTLLSSMLAVFAGAVQATTEPSIVVDGKKLELKGGARVETVDGHVMIPIRMVTENLGFQVGWDAQNRGVSIAVGSRTINLAVGSKSALVDGVEKSLLVAPVLKNGVTGVPLRFVSEQMGMIVDWDDATKTVSVNRPAPTASDSGTVTVDDISLDERQLKITVSGKVEPKVFTMSGPERIVIDLPGTSLSPALEDRSSQKGVVSIANSSEIAGVRYALFSDSPSTVRVVMDLNSPSPYAVTRGSADEVLVELTGEPASTPGTDIPGSAAPGSGPQLPPVTQPEPPPIASGKKLIVIDPGHGGKDPGTIGITNKLEKVFNLNVALKIQKLLDHDPNMEVVFTRTDDRFIKLGDRAPVANKINADAFISIHANSVENAPSANGTESYYYEVASKSFTQIIHKHLLEATGFRDRGVKQAGWKVLRDANMVSVLLEAGFISNAAEEAKLFTDDMQQRIAQGVVNGLKEYFGFA